MYQLFEVLFSVITAQALVMNVMILNNNQPKYKRWLNLVKHKIYVITALLNIIFIKLAYTHLGIIFKYLKKEDFFCIYLFHKKCLNKSEFKT